MAKIAVTIEQAKERFNNACRAARDADRLTAALYDRLAADTLLAAKGQPPERACTMLMRMAVALEVLAERRGWPERIHGLPDRQQKSPRAVAEAVFNRKVLKSPTRLAALQSARSCIGC
jgi:hypothetical protein